MTSSLVKALLAEQTPGVQLLYGVATGLNTVKIAGSDVAVTLPALNPVAAGDYVAVLTQGADRLILGAVDNAGWTSWTPTVRQSGVVPFTNFLSRYVRGARRKIDFVTSLNVTGTGTAANPITVSLPVAAAISGIPIGQGVLFDASTTMFYPAIAWLQSTTTVSLFNATTSAGAQILGQAIFTAALTSPDTIQISGSYEAAS